MHGRKQGLVRELALRRDELRQASERADLVSELHTRGLQRLASPRSFFADGFDIGAILETFLSGHASSAQAIEELAASRVERPFIGEVPRPYFDALYRELTAAFDEEAPEGAIVTADWDLEGEVETEVLVHDAQGRIIRRRVTRRSLGERENGPA